MSRNCGFQHVRKIRFSVLTGSASRTAGCLQRLRTPGEHPLKTPDSSGSALPLSGNIGARRNMETGAFLRLKDDRKQEAKSGVISNAEMKLNAERSGG